MPTHAELTPQVLMDRFFSLIRDVKIFDELSPLVLERYLEVPFTKNAGENSGFYMLDQPSPYSKYATTYNFDEKFSQYSNVTLELISPSSVPPASLPPCELIFEEYDSALKDAGFEPQLGIYNEFGWVISFQYLRGNIRAQIIPWETRYFPGNDSSGLSARSEASSPRTQAPIPCWGRRLKKRFPAALKGLHLAVRYARACRRCRLWDTGPDFFAWLVCSATLAGPVNKFSASSYMMPSLSCAYEVMSQLEDLSP